MRVAVPLTVSDEAVRIAVIGKLRWIRRQRPHLQAKPSVKRELLAGESLLPRPPLSPRRIDNTGQERSQHPQPAIL